MTPPKPLCSERVYSRNFNDPPRNCRAPATRDGFCYAHLPETIKAREERAVAAAAKRLRKKNLEQRRLLLIPILDQAKKTRNKLEEKHQFGAGVIVREIEDAIRES